MDSDEERTTTNIMLKELTIDDEPATTTTTTTNNEKKKNNVEQNEALPQVFVVKALGKRDCRGLWGVKHTRGPVDDMVASARSLKPGSFLPFLQLRVSKDGVDVTEMPQNQNQNFDGGFYPVDVVSYGVQDLVYTRVFAMIVVRESLDDAGKDSTSSEQRRLKEVGSGGSGGLSPKIECHAYVCDSRHNARRLTFALATAFKLFSNELKSNNNQSGSTSGSAAAKRERARQFAIDLRTPDELRSEVMMVNDSEA